MSILGEYLQRVKAERDEAVSLLRGVMSNVVWPYEKPTTPDHIYALVKSIEAFLSRYDLPDDYDEA